MKYAENNLENRFFMGCFYSTSRNFAGVPEDNQATDNMPGE